MANDMSKQDKYCKISLVCESEKGKLTETESELETLFSGKGMCERSGEGISFWVIKIPYNCEDSCIIL